MVGFLVGCCCSEHTIDGSALGRQSGCLGRRGFQWSLSRYWYILGADKKMGGLEPKTEFLIFPWAP